MKKLLCVLLFGLMFGQAELTTKEITIPIDENTEMIDIGNYVDLVSGFYTLQLIYVEFINENSMDCTDALGFISELGFGGISFQEDEEFIYFHVGDIVTISYDNSNIIPYHDGIDDNCAINVNFVLRVSGRFEDTDTSLNGDMNGDGTLDVLDVVSLVQEILNGGMGDVGDLLNIVRG